MPDHTGQALAEAMEGLYRVFGRYSIPVHVVGCPCCVHDQDHARLHAHALRELSGDDLAPYARKALTTWGVVEDFKHFLPRLFELMATGGLKFPDYEILVGKLKHAGWTTGDEAWPTDEVEAVRAFFTALWTDVLSHESGYRDAREWLCVIAQAEDDLQPYLTTWRTMNSDTSLRHLAIFVDREVGNIEHRMLANIFWRERYAQMQQVVDWLYSPATVARFTAALALFEDETQERLYYPVEYLRHIVHA